MTGMVMLAALVVSAAFSLITGSPRALLARDGLVTAGWAGYMYLSLLARRPSWLAAQDDPVQAGHAIRRFGALIQATPSLRAYQSDMMDQFTAVAAAILAERAGMSPDDPEPQIAATALLGLWRVQFQSLSRYLDGTRIPAQVHQAVTGDVRRAAQLIETGLNSFGAFSAGTDDDRG